MCKQAQTQQVWMSPQTLGPLLLLLSAMLFSGMGCFVKLASETGIPSTQLVFLRAVFQGCIVVTSMIFLRENDEVEKTDVSKFNIQTNQLGKRLIWVPLGRSKENIQVVLLRGMVGGIGFVIYYFTIKSIPLGDAMTLLSLTPIVTVFLARCVLGEPIQCIQLIATLISVLGAMFIAGGPSTLLLGADELKYYNPFGYVTALFGAIFSAGVFVLVRKAGTMGAHTLQLLFSWCIFGLFFSLLLGLGTYASPALASFLEEDPWHMPPTSESWWYIFGLCAFGTSAHFLMNYAARLSHAALSSIVRSSDIMWSYILEVVVFHELPSFTTWTGVFLIFCALILVTWDKLNEILFEVSPVIKDANQEDIVVLKSQDYGSMSGSSQESNV